MESMGVVVTRYIDFLMIHIPTPLVSALFCSSSINFWECFSLLFWNFFVIYVILFRAV